MQELPKTFCPGKWNEITINIDSSLVYSCCKAMPLKFNGDYKKVIGPQQKNLLQGIQDSSCNYCWELENKNLPSRRQKFLDNFDLNTFNDYNETKPPVTLELVLGNECNFQCLYCNPKYSSKWNADILKRPYKLFNSNFNYEPFKNITDRHAKDEQFLEYIKNSKTKSLSILGGEPFLYKNLYTLLDSIDVETLRITTNLSCEIEQLQTFLDKTKKFNKVLFCISLDANKEVAEFVRHGLNFDKLIENLNWLQKNKTDNLQILVLSLMTSITITDLKNFKNTILSYLHKDSNMNWWLFDCISPEFQSFSTLKNEYKNEIISLLNELEKNNQIYHANLVKERILASTFNKTLYKQLELFVNEFANRKRISIPVKL